MLKKLDIYQKNEGAGQKPTKDEFEGILAALNNQNFVTRIVPIEGKYNEPKFEGNNRDCHATMFAEINGWKKVSGYLIEKVRLDEDKNFIKLTAHSVVRDNSGNLLEFMEFVYPLRKYYFILHNSGSQGYDLKAIR